MPFGGSLPVQNRPTRKLFKEFHPEGADSIERWRQVFLDHSDPTEYSAALELVGDWKDWQRFKKQWPQFNRILDGWKKEVEVKLRSDALKELIKKSKNDVSAARFIVEGKYSPPKNIKVEREREQEIVQRVFKDNEEELGRVFNVIPPERFERKAASSS